MTGIVFAMRTDVVKIKQYVLDISKYLNLSKEETSMLQAAIEAASTVTTKDIMTPINPGITKVVKLLNDNGFTTVDSGDGETHDFECDRPYGYVVIRTYPECLIGEAKRLAELLRKHGVKMAPLGPEDNLCFIQANYSPVDGLALIDVRYITDKCLSQQGE